MRSKRMCALVLKGPPIALPEEADRFMGERPELVALNYIMHHSLLREVMAEVEFTLPPWRGEVPPVLDQTIGNY
eukprot:11169466-Lingulodinium_polyedra.AAC.1